MTHGSADFRVLTNSTNNPNFTKDRKHTHKIKNALKHKHNLNHQRS